MKKSKIIHIISFCLIFIIHFSCQQSNGNEIFKRKLNMYITNTEIKLHKINVKNADLIFTVKNIESFITITGWASDGYKCNIGKIIKGNITDTKIYLYLFHNSIQSKNIRKLKSEDTLIIGFFKNKNGNIEYEGFREKNGIRWNLSFIKNIKR